RTRPSSGVEAGAKDRRRVRSFFATNYPTRKPPALKLLPRSGPRRLKAPTRAQRERQHRTRLVAAKGRTEITIASPEVRSAKQRYGSRGVAGTRIDPRQCWIPRRNP